MPFTTGPILNQSSAGFSASTVTVAVTSDNPSFGANIEIVVFSLNDQNQPKTLIGQDLYSLNTNGTVMRSYDVSNIPVYEIQIDYFSGFDISFNVFAVNASGNFVPDKRVLGNEFTFIDRLTI